MGAGVAGIFRPRRPYPSHPWGLRPQTPASAWTASSSNAGRAENAGLCWKVPDGLRMLVCAEKCPRAQRKIAPKVHEVRRNVCRNVRRLTVGKGAPEAGVA